MNTNTGTPAYGGSMKERLKLFLAFAGVLAIGMCLAYVMQELNGKEILFNLTIGRLLP